MAKTALLGQARAARAALDRHQPDRVLTIGGDCLVDLAPTAYLNKRYGGEVGVLWIDAHPDVQTPALWPHAHAHVLAMLLGEGDVDFVREVERPIQPAKVMYAGLDEYSSTEGKVIDRFGLKRTTSNELAKGNRPVLDWIEQERVKHIAIHLDVDAINPGRFRPILFNKPDRPSDYLEGVPRGRLEPGQVARLLHDVAGGANIVGLAITEFISWDALQTQRLLSQLPLVRD